MVLALAEDEKVALDVAERGLRGLMRRTHYVHRWDTEILGEDAADAAIRPLQKLLANIDGAIEAGAGTPEQIRDRFAGILDAGLTDHIVIMSPTGDMTFDEAKRTMDLFCGDVKPELMK